MDTKFLTLSVLSNFGRKVIDRVRVDAANSLRHAPWLRKVVKSSRYLLYKRPENLSEKEHTKLAELSKLNLSSRTYSMHTGYSTPAAL